MRIQKARGEDGEDIEVIEVKAETIGAEGRASATLTKVASEGGVGLA